MMLASCSYSLEMGRETQLQYNWEALEKQIIDRFIRGRPQVEFEVSSSLPFSVFFELTRCNRTRANHDYKLYVKVTIPNCYKYSFFVRIVNVWTFLYNALY